MRIAGRDKIQEFAKKHSTSAASLYRRVAIVGTAAWKTPADVRATFRSVDFVGRRTVFNIGGNKVRVIALIEFNSQLVIVQAVLTNVEYDKGKWR